MVEVKTQFFIL